MMRLSYAGGSFLTGDDIATSVLDLGAALAQAQEAERIEIPGISDEGIPGTYAVLLGPASQIMAQPVPGDHDLVDEVFVTATREHSTQTIAATTGKVALISETPPVTTTDFDDV